MGGSSPLVSARQFGYRYHRDAPLAVHDLNLHLDHEAWLLLTGASGSGKSTFARALNGTVPHFYGGQVTGTLNVCGIDPAEVPMSTTFRHVGCLFQDPVAQLFEPTVERELAFGLESLALPPREVGARVESIAMRMGITDLLQRAPQTLSGGEQQLILLAAFLALAPQILVLDEPMSMLDARARQRIYAALKDVHAQGTGLVVIDHQPDIYIESATHFALMEEGSITSKGSPTDVVMTLLRRPDQGVAPPPAALWWKERIMPVLHKDVDLPATLHLPLTVRNARQYIEHLPVEILKDICPPALLQAESETHASTKHEAAGHAPLVEWSNVTYAYTSVHANSWLNTMRSTIPAGNALHNVSGMLWPGEIVALVGPNGAGKSTLLRTLNGLVRPQRGEVRVCGKPVGQRPVAELARVVGYAPQRPERLFFCSTVVEELTAGPRALGIEGTTRGWQTMLIEMLGLRTFLNHSPYTLSVGQQRRVALAAALASRPQVVALDEPTAGLDADARATLAGLLRELANAGAAVVIVTHDIEFANSIASRWLVLVAGRLVADDTPARIMMNDALLVEAALEPSASYLLDHLLYRRFVGEYTM
jgi:energy-coupling factor transporter ATP-binding protein EcfA2